MANIETLAADTRYFAEVAAPATPSAGQAVTYVKTDGKLYLKDDAGTETDLTAGGVSFSGYPIVIVPQGCAIAWTHSATPTSNATGDIARAAPVLIPSAMKLRSMWIAVGTSAAGSIEWGLFDLGSTLTAATKVAGGSAAPGGTGWREIAATGAPVSVAAGAYMLIVENPATNPSTIHTYSANAAPGFFKAWSTYTWDDTPDLTSGSWSDSSIMYAAYLEGDMNASNTRW